MKLRNCWLLALVLVWSGCGGQERREATALYQTLHQKQTEFAAANASEKDLFRDIRTWYEGVLKDGGGKGNGLEDNASSATSMAQSASNVTSQLSQLRQAIYNQPLQEEFAQGVRGVVLSQLMKRQRTLQDVRTALEACATNFHEFGQSRAYKGDTYPAGIDKLNAMLSGYLGPEDTLGKAMAGLKEKYAFTEAELAGKS